MEASLQKGHWIVSPTADVGCVSLGWVGFFLITYLLPQYTSTMQFIAVSTFVAHRYITFPLVYLDKGEFGRRPAVYLVTPILALAFVGACYYFRVNEPEMFVFWYLFTFFHIVRQKYGILRVYSGKTGWGSKRLDEWTVYLWGFAGLCYMLTFAPGEGRVMHYLRTLMGGAAPPVVVTQVLYTAAVLVTGWWLFHELRGKANVPKVLFMGSTIFLLGACPILSPDATSIASSFSHAAEYFAMVGLMLNNKARSRPADMPILATIAQRTALHIVLFIVYINLLFLGIKSLSLMAFQVIAYGASFTHYIYDGMIWRVRRPRVAQEVGVASAA